MSRVRPGPYVKGPSDVITIASELDREAIEIGVVRPQVPSGHRVPVIVLATPYLNHTLTEETVAGCAPRLVDNYVQHGYAVGLVSVRGTSGSGGCSDLMGPAERADLDQAITWFGEQPWSNGRVGMIGVSYDGGTAWEVAASGNKYLKTIVPISGVNDFFELFYRHGIPEYRSPGVLNALYYLYPFFPADPTTRPPAQNVTSVLCPEAIEGLLAAPYSVATGERDPLGFWAERNSRPGVEKNYRGSIFLARGLQDWNVDPAHDLPWVAELEKKGFYVKYMLGQWDHQWPDSASADEVMEPGEPVRWDWADVLLRWWDRWLKDDRTQNIGPRVQVQDSSGRWRNERSWPPKDAVETALYLDADNRLVPGPSATTAEVPIAYDASKMYSSASTRPCICARFRLAPSGMEMRFAGVPELDLTITPLGPGGHVSAYLYSGDQLVGWGAVDLRFAQGDSPQPVVPGSPIKVRLPLEPLDAVVAGSDTLTLLIGQAGYGGNGAVTYRNSAMAVPFRLAVGGDASKMTLRTFSRNANAFFTPPKRPRSAPPS